MAANDMEGLRSRTLKELVFSDVILTGKSAFLKGIPGMGPQLVPIEDAFRVEVQTLFDLVENKFKTTSSDSSLRISHIDCTYRAACYMDVVHGASFFLRRLADKVPELTNLGLPHPLVKWFKQPEQKKGLILISGPQSGGKTTTAASLVQERLREYGGHAITFENPVEMPLAGPHGAHGLCFQTEITSEGELAAHIERAHRYSSPNIIYIGEIRSKYAASEALRVALGSSQQLIIATIHGISATAALDRLLIWAKELDGDVACRNLSQTLLAIMQQELTSELALKVPEFLLLPFTDVSTSIRAKLREGNLNLDDDIREQRNRINAKGLEEFL